MAGYPDQRIKQAAEPADLPSVDRLLNVAAGVSWQHTVGHARLKAVLRDVLAVLRQQALQGSLAPERIEPDAIFQAVAQRLRKQDESRLKAVFNLTGTVLHTNLGRALLPDEAVEAAIRALRHPVNLEYELANGGRGDRDTLVEDLLCELTGAEAATVVNNNAAAVLLLLNTLADQQQVVVSRGELVEIGGSFRIPDVMKRAGSQLVEVGTTNRTHVADYEQAIGEQTALLLKVHCSNYAISGFTGSVSMAEMARVAHAHGLPAAMDMGSGTLVDLSLWGLPQEDTVRDILQAGADVATFSGDKLLGGPQAGLIVGSEPLISKIRSNPLKRALRVDKVRLAALEAVLQLYRSPELLPQRLTTYRLLTRAVADIQAQAQRVLPAVQAAVGQQYSVTAAPMFSQIGSGALPVEEIPSHGLAIRSVSAGSAGRALLKLEAQLRALPRPVIGRVAHNALWLDLRCLQAEDESRFLTQLTGGQP